MHLSGKVHYKSFVDVFAEVNVVTEPQNVTKKFLII